MFVNMGVDMPSLTLSFSLTNTNTVYSPYLFNLLKINVYIWGESGKGLINISEPQIIELRQWWRTEREERLNF